MANRYIESVNGYFIIDILPTFFELDYGDIHLGMLFVILYILNIENKLHNFTVFDKIFTMEFSDLSLSVSIR